MLPQAFEYKVIPAPRRAEKDRALKTTEDRFAHTLASVMNTLGREGWEYIRAESLPCEERSGLTGRKTVTVEMLVFRRPRVAGQPVVEEVVVAPPRALGAATAAPVGAAPALGSPLE